MIKSTDKSGTVEFCAYRGNSMYPTLRHDDLLELSAYNAEPVRIGDVVAFCSPENERLVIHRVIAITEQAIHTRGDNNFEPDPWKIEPERIIGRVIVSWDAKTQRVIYAGWRGRTVGFLVRRQRFIRRHFSRMLRPLCHMFFSLSILKQFWKHCLDLRIVAFETHADRSFQLLLNNRIVGWYDINVSTWRIRSPFHLVVDKHCLPEISVADLSG